MQDALAAEMEARKAVAWAHIEPCTACTQRLDADGLCCPEGEALMAYAAEAIAAYTRSVLQQGQWN